MNKNTAIKIPEQSLDLLAFWGLRGVKKALSDPGFVRKYEKWKAEREEYYGRPIEELTTKERLAKL